MNKKALGVVGFIILIVGLLYYFSQSGTDTTQVVEVHKVQDAVLVVDTIEEVSPLDALVMDVLTTPLDTNSRGLSGSASALPAPDLSGVEEKVAVPETPSVPVVAFVPEPISENLAVRLDEVLITYENLTPTEKINLGPELAQLVHDLSQLSDTLKRADAKEILALNTSLQNLVNHLEEFVMVLENYVEHIIAERINS